VTPRPPLRSRAMIDAIIAELDTATVRKLFAVLDLNAQTHDPVERQIYVGLFRRLYG
jgi:hypothetical protein